MARRRVKPWPPKYASAVEKAQLTERQARVLNDWINHRSMRRIALALGISEATARGHFDAAIRKIRPYIEAERKDAA